MEDTGQISRLSGGSGVDISRASIEFLANSIQNGIANAFSQFLPNLLNALTPLVGYAAGKNMYGDSRFLQPLSGNNAFTAEQARRASASGVVNSDAYAVNYARSLGLDTSGTPAEVSNRISFMSGGVEMMNRGAQRAWEASANRYGVNPLAMMDESRSSMRNRAFATEAQGIIDDFNSMSREDRARIIGEESADRKFVSIADIQSAMARQEVEYGGVPDEDFKNRFAQRVGEAEKLRMGERDADAAKIVQSREDVFAEAGRAEREAASKRLSDIDYRLQDYALDPEARRALEAERNGLRRQVSALTPSTAFDRMSDAERTFRVTTAADMAVNEAMAYNGGPKTEEEWQAFTNSDESVRTQHFALENMKQFMRDTGSAEMGRELISKFAATLTPESLDNGRWFETIRSAIGGDSEQAGEIARELKESLASTDSEQQNAAVLRAVMYAKQASLTGEDATGLTGMSKLVSNAMSATGGNVSAAMDAVNMAMAYEGVGDMTAVDDKTIRSMNHTISVASKLGDAETVMAKTFDDVTEALEQMGVATRDATGRQTKMVGAMARASLEQRAGLGAAGVSMANAETITNEAAMDVAGSESGKFLAGILGMASFEDKDWANALSNRFSGKSKEDIIQGLRSGSAEDQALLSRFLDLSSDSRSRYEATGMSMVDVEKHRQSAAAELLGSDTDEFGKSLRDTALSAARRHGWASKRSNLEHEGMRSVLASMGIGDVNDPNLSENQKRAIGFLSHFDLNDEKQEEVLRNVIQNGFGTVSANFGDLQDMTPGQFWSHFGKIARGSKGKTAADLEAEFSGHPSAGMDPDEYNKLHEAERLEKEKELAAVNEKLKDKTLSGEQRFNLNKKQADLQTEIDRLTAPGSREHETERLTLKAELEGVNAELENPETSDERKGELRKKRGELLRDIKSLTPKMDDFDFGTTLSPDARADMERASRLAGQSGPEGTPDPNSFRFADKVNEEIEKFQSTIKTTNTTFETLDNHLKPLLDETLPNFGVALTGLAELLDLFKSAYGGM